MSNPVLSHDHQVMSNSVFLGENEKNISKCLLKILTRVPSINVQIVRVYTDVYFRLYVPSVN